MIVRRRRIRKGETGLVLRGVLFDVLRCWAVGILVSSPYSADVALLTFQINQFIIWLGKVIGLVMSINDENLGLAAVCVHYAVLIYSCYLLHFNLALPVPFKGYTAFRY